MGRKSGIREKIIEAITAPLGFFVLALLIVETALVISIKVISFQPPDQLKMVYLAFGAFALVVVVVGLLVAFCPENLTFDKESHLRAQGKPPFGTESKIETSPDKLEAFESNQQTNR